MVSTPRISSSAEEKATTEIGVSCKTVSRRSAVITISSSAWAKAPGENRPSDNAEEIARERGLGDGSVTLLMLALL